MTALFSVLAGIASKVVGNMFPDPADQQKRDEATQKFTLGIMENAQQIEQAAASIVRAEASSQHWLAANWRPLTMLTFVGLIVARWFGWSAPGLSEAEALALWDIVQLGLGGYVVGRSAEKIVPMLAGALKK